MPNVALPQWKRSDSGVSICVQEHCWVIFKGGLTCSPVFLGHILISVLTCIMPYLITNQDPHCLDFARAEFLCTPHTEGGFGHDHQSFMGNGFIAVQAKSEIRSLNRVKSLFKGFEGKF